jgi:tRNA threonylcarbamoyladenosine biosynthesis protein TsaB
MPPSDAPCLLALDSATERVAVALVVGDRHWAADEPGGARASERLLPMAFEALLAHAGVEGRSVQAVAFGRGPGAFTGLRTACAVAQGLAFGWSCPVLPLDSLALVAEDARADTDESIWVAMDARMDEVYAAHYRPLEGGWQALQAPRPVDAAGVAGRLGRRAATLRGRHGAGGLRGASARRRGAACGRAAPTAPPRWRGWPVPHGPVATRSTPRWRCRCTCATRWR